MAAIAAKAAIFVVLLAAPVWADRAADVLSQIAYAGNALSNNNAADAMSPFDKSCKNYDQIKDDFVGLTNAFAIRNELNVTDEDDSLETETKVTVNWTIILSAKGGTEGHGTDDYGGQERSEHASEERSGEVQVRLVLEKGKWKVVEFSPLTIFDPLVKSKK